MQACGRSEPGDYLYGSDDPITTGASTGTAGRGSTTGGTRSSNAGTSSTAGRGVGGSGVGGTVVGGGSGPIPQAGQPSFGGAVAMGGFGTAGTTPIAGAGGSVSVTPIVCGDQTCNAKTQSCCAGLSGLNCVGKGQACDGAVLGCTVNANCSGNDVCCISITGDINQASSCKARCDNMGTGRDRQLCQADDECLPPFRFCTPTIFGVNICTRRP